MKTKNLLILAAALVFSVAGMQSPAAETPKVGDPAPDFTLKTLDDQTVRLSELTSKQPAVLVVLRGWPGYQCPVCDRQVNEFIKAAAEFNAAKAKVVFIYPGPADYLKTHAKEFQAMKGRQWPKEFAFVLDPDYAMVNAYGLRWSAPQETAYPSTFVVDKKGTVQFAKVSKGHGDRSKAADVLSAIKSLAAK